MLAVMVRFDMTTQNWSERYTHCDHKNKDRLNACIFWGSFTRETTDIHKSTWKSFLRCLLWLISWGNSSADPCLAWNNLFIQISTSYSAMGNVIVYWFATLIVKTHNLLIHLIEYPLNLQMDHMTHHRTCVLLCELD